MCPRQARSPLIGLVAPTHSLARATATPTYTSTTTCSNVGQRKMAENRGVCREDNAPAARRLDLSLRRRHASVQILCRRGRFCRSSCSWASASASAPPARGRRRIRSAAAVGLRWRGARCRRGHGQARVDLGEAPMTRDVPAPADDAIGERDARFSATELAHLEARGGLAAHIEAAAVALGRDEHVIAGRLDHFREIAIELHRRASVLEPRRAEVLELVLRALHAWSTRCVRSGNGTTAFFTVAVSVPLTTRRCPAKKPAKEFGLVVRPTMPTLLEKPNTPMSVRRADHAGEIDPTCRRRRRWSGISGTGGPAVPEMPVTPLSAPEMLCTPGPKNDTARTAVPVNDAPCAPSPRARSR